MIKCRWLVHAVDFWLPFSAGAATWDEPTGRGSGGQLLLERFPKAKRSKSKLTLLLSLFFVVSVLKKSKCLQTETGFVIVAVNLLFRASFSLYNNILAVN